MYPGERFNSISHLVGAALALAGSVVLIVLAARPSMCKTSFAVNIP